MEDRPLTDTPAVGDIVLFYHARGRDRIITLVTRSPFYHVALCCEPHTVVEAVPKGVRRRDLRDADDAQPYAVIEGPAAARQAAVEWALSQVGDGYDSVDLAVIALHRLFRVFRVNYVIGDRYTCGELVASAYERAGHKLFAGIDSEDVVPGDFARLLPEPARHAIAAEGVRGFRAAG